VRPDSQDPMSPEAVTRRLWELSERSDLSAARRLATKVDMSPEAVTRRLRTQSQLRDACLAWGRRRPPGPKPAP
jgi:hypothetical protein